MTQEQKVKAMLSRLLDKHSVQDCRVVCLPVEVEPVDGWKCYEPGPVTRVSLLLAR